MNIKTLDTVDVRGKRVLLRCDLNVPLKDGVITDDGRIKASLPTIKYLLAQGASVVITAHLGRPKGERKPELIFSAGCERDCQNYLGQNVNFSKEIVGAKIAGTGVTLLENISDMKRRKLPRMKPKDLVLAKGSLPLTQMFS
jgi:phosphoglycerate kinase